MERKVRTLNKEEKMTGDQDKTSRKCKRGINLKENEQANTGNAMQYSTKYQWMNTDTVLQMSANTPASCSWVSFPSILS